jgi:hypothetical protein
VFPTSIARIPGRSFLVRNLDELPLPTRSPPRNVEGVPYAGRRIAVIEGNAGEWLELIEGERVLRPGYLDAADLYLLA